MLLQWDAVKNHFNCLYCSLVDWCRLFGTHTWWMNECVYSFHERDQAMIKQNAQKWFHLIFQYCLTTHWVNWFLNCLIFVYCVLRTSVWVFSFICLPNEDSSDFNVYIECQKYNKFAEIISSNLDLCQTICACIAIFGYGYGSSRKTER